MRPPSSGSGQPGRGPTAPKPSGWSPWVLPVLFVLSFVLLGLPGWVGGGSATSLPYSSFVGDVSAGTVASVTIDAGGGVSGKLTNGSAFTTQLPTALPDSRLAPLLQAKHVAVTARRGGASSVWTVLGALVPWLLIAGVVVWFGRRAGRLAAGGISGIGRSKVTIIEAERPTTRFTDVAGYDGVKQEVGEIVDFLRHPDHYAAAGARGPQGVLMVGPPGTGKTLLARALAGEAEVPFLPVTGSGFVEMFVGVGAARVRDLFDEARKHAPSIVFIDEIDTIGGRRNAGGISGNDEREQTLNQLLAEMDGFDQSSGIVVLAATNRPETLDPALLRPGRFDRQVTIPLPSQAERLAILTVHARGKHLADDIDLAVVARATPGFSGADLANLLNEAAINAVRTGSTTICAADLDAARDRVLLGRPDTAHALLPEERHAVAVHESGHALVAALCRNADPVAKVSVLPAGLSLGVTEQLPEVERRLYSEAYLTDLLTVRLGGRAAELVVLGQGSTGASDDLAAATQVATRMVREFGLSPAMGPVGYAGGGPGYLGVPEDRDRAYSEQTQRIVDNEVARLLREAERRAVDLLDRHRPALDRLAALLVEHETVGGSQVLRVLRDEPADQAGGSIRQPVRS